MFENLKDEAISLADAQKVIEGFRPDELAELREEFDRSGNCHAYIVREGKPEISLRLENVNGIVWLTVADSYMAGIFCANECKELFK